ncbi:MAG TPA: EAL domain-containing protein [Actinoplanes sp.]|nr:EAL domain-containing protein [Actinoplanes sp.]
MSVAFGAAGVTAAVVLLPQPVAGGLLAAGAAVPGTAMLWAALRSRTAGPRFRAGLLGAGLLLTGVIGIAAAVVTAVIPDAVADGVPLAAHLYLLNLILAVLVTLPALLRPQQHREPLARLRAALDIVGVSACLILPTWVLILSGGYLRGASAIASFLGAVATAVAAVAGVHAVRHRAALRWAGPGLALALICLIALVIGADNPANPNSGTAALAAGAALNAAAWAMWWGGVRVDPDAVPVPVEGSEPAAGFPLFTLPVLGAAISVVARLLHGGDLDEVAIALCVTALFAVATREFVAAIALRRHADHLTHHGKRLRNLMFGSSDVAMVLDSGLAVRWQSPAAARHFGLSDQGVLGHPVAALVDPEQAAELERFLTVRLGGEASDESFSAVFLDGLGRRRETEWTAGGADPAIPGRSLVIHIRDVSEQRELEQALEQANHRDPLTGMANVHGLRHLGRPATDGALIELELRGLTAIADVHGTDRSEAVLLEAARRIRSRLSATDVPARIGDTRFAVITRNGALLAHVLASQLVTELAAPYDLDGVSAHLQVWAGLSELAPETGIDEVMRRAVLGLRAALSRPPGGVEWYDEAVEQELVRRSTLEQDLPTALARNELELLFQPVFELAGRRPVGVEVILNWRHPALGRIPACELLALADDLGVLGDLRIWALNRMCRHAAVWRGHYRSMWFSFGVRPAELGEDSFHTALETVLRTHQLPRSALVVEISEDDLHHGAESDERLADHLRRLRLSDIRTAVGHFGAGPTSLSRLRILPVDQLKVDRTVFSQQNDDAAAVGVVMEVAVTLGRRLGMDVVAHGLASEADLETVLATGCRLGQGDQLARPMPAEHLEALIERFREVSPPPPAPAVESPVRGWMGP